MARLWAIYLVVFFFYNQGYRFQNLPNSLFQSVPSSHALSFATNSLIGAFAHDPEIKLCAARAFFVSARYNDCIQQLEAIGFYTTEQTQLLLTNAYKIAWQKEFVTEKFEYCADYFGRFESIDKELNAEFLKRLQIAKKLMQ